MPVIQNDLLSPKQKLSASLAITILDVLSKHRRVSKEENKEIPHHPGYSEIVQNQVQAMITQGKKIRLVMPAFPWKSAARGKTLNDAPDMAELVSLKHLNQICEEIKKVYPVGAEMVIYTDGFAFQNILPESYTIEKRLAYFEQLTKMIEKNKLLNLSVVNLEDKVNLKDYAESDENFHKRVKNPRTQADINNVNLYCGQIHFFTTELLMEYPNKPHCQIVKEAKKIARGITRMSTALSAYLTLIEPDALRLSCHPKTENSDKIGIWFNEAHSEGGTPWHNAAVFEIQKTNGKCGVSFMKTSEARKQGHILKNDQTGNPGHYVSKTVYHFARVIQLFFKAHQSKKSRSIQHNNDRSINPPEPSKQHL